MSRNQGQAIPDQLEDLAHKLDSVVRHLGPVRGFMHGSSHPTEASPDTLTTWES